MLESRPRLEQDCLGYLSSCCLLPQDRKQRGLCARWAKHLEEHGGRGPKVHRQSYKPRPTELQQQVERPVGIHPFRGSGRVQP